MVLMLMPGHLKTKTDVMAYVKSLFVLNTAVFWC